MTESEVQQHVQIDAMQWGCQLMRNNSGAFKNEAGQFVRFGLGNVSTQQSEKIKSSDLIGFTHVVITPEMVGRCLAVFTAIEVKDGDWVPIHSDKRWKAQSTFLTWITKNGGIAFLVNSREAFKQNIERCLESVGL